MRAALVQAGLLRRLIPPPPGGEMTGLVDLAIEAEELMAVETHRAALVCEVSFDEVRVDLKARLEAARYLTWKALRRAATGCARVPAVRRRQLRMRRPYLQALFAQPGYDPLAAADSRPQPN